MVALREARAQDDLDADHRQRRAEQAEHRAAQGQLAAAAPRLSRRGERGVGSGCGLQAPDDKGRDKLETALRSASSQIAASPLEAGAGSGSPDGARVPILYLMGHGFSGSTLLAMLLGCHPELVTTGELGVAESHKETTSADRYLCSCRRPLRDCPFWRRVEREMAVRGHPFDAWDAQLDFRVAGGGVADVLLRALLRGRALETARAAGLRVVGPARRQLRVTLDRIAAFADVVTGLAGARVFVDASKRPERPMFMRLHPRLDVRVVHLVRDGRAVACSSMRNLGWSVERAADSWLADNLRSEAACRRLPAGRWVRVRYEDLCADAGGTLARLHRFAGVTPCDEVPRFREQEQHVIGNRMRLDSLGEIRPDERWRETLLPAQRRTLERRLGALNARYGYSTEVDGRC